MRIRSFNGKKEDVFVLKFSALATVLSSRWPLAVTTLAQISLVRRRTAARRGGTGACIALTTTFML